MSKIGRFGQRLGFTVSAVLFSGITYAAGGVDDFMSEKIKKFTPSDVKVVVPTSDVPKECAVFTGEWGPGTVSHVGTAIKVIFENIAPDCTAKVVSVYAERQEFPNDPGAGSRRHDTKIVKGAFELKGVGKMGSMLDMKINSAGTDLQGNATNSRGQSVYLELPR